MLRTFNTDIELKKQRLKQMIQMNDMRVVHLDNVDIPVEQVPTVLGRTHF